MVEPDHHTYRLLDITSGTSTEFMTSPALSFSVASFSPDKQWAGVTTTDGHLLMVPVRDSRVDEKEWITVSQTKAPGGHQWPAFSPDGHTIYYVSNEDGHACIYARRLSANRQPSGSPTVVQHLRNNACSHPHGMAVGADRSCPDGQGTSNIWLMQPRE
jgi:Tol biopolymer transport system component